MRVRAHKIQIQFLTQVHSIRTELHGLELEPDKIA